MSALSYLPSEAEAVRLFCIDAMTDKKRKREAPLSVRLPKALRLKLVHGAAAAGLNLNAYVVLKLSNDSSLRMRGKTPVKDQKRLAHVLTMLGQIATTLRDIAHQGIDPQHDAEFRQTMENIKHTCWEIMAALGRPGSAS